MLCINVHIHEMLLLQKKKGQGINTVIVIPLCNFLMSVTLLFFLCILLNSIVFLGSPPQCNAWVGQCGLYILVMVVEKILMTLLIQFNFWRDVSGSKCRGIVNPCPAKPGYTLPLQTV